MNTKNLITVKKFADQFPSLRNGIGVSPAYIYKLIEKNKNSGFRLVVIAERHFIEVLDKKEPATK